MEQIRNLGDQRTLCFCANCGNRVETRDHVPPKVFLDEPYPDNLPVVPMCKSCNLDSSKDEEYIACFMECVVAGNCDEVNRRRIQRILEEKRSLKLRLQNSMRIVGSDTLFEVEQERVKKVVLKMARGLAIYELHSAQYETPSRITILPLGVLTEDQLDRFETLPVPTVGPEVGSRGMDRLAGTFPQIGWVVVQPYNFRYLAYVDQRVSIRMVIRECLACEVIW